MKNIRVREFMQSQPEAAREDMLLPELVTLLRARGYRAVPVTDAEGHVVGTVSETDLFLKEHTLPFSTEKVPSLLGRVISPHQIRETPKRRPLSVASVMHRSAVTVDEETTLEELAILMCERHLSMVPVVRDGVLVGVARRGDILAIIYQQTAA